MTLSELYSKFVSRPTVVPATVAYVFEDEDSAESFVMDKYFGEHIANYALVCVLSSDMRLEYTLKEEWCNADVEYFYAVEPDTIVVVVYRRDDAE